MELHLVKCIHQVQTIAHLHFCFIIPPTLSSATQLQYTVNSWESTVAETCSHLCCCFLPSLPCFVIVPHGCTLFLCFLKLSSLHVSYLYTRLAMQNTGPYSIEHYEYTLSQQFIFRSLPALTVEKD